MKLLELRNLVRKDVPIYYRRHFTGTAIFAFLDMPKEVPVQFSIETLPAGNKQVDVNILSETDYPLVPLLKSLKERVNELDSLGDLPD